MTSHPSTVETPYGVVTAHWHRQGRMIFIRYGERVRREKASEHDAVNETIARDVLRRWIAEDLSEGEAA
jgi:hypothetical protein